MKPRKGQFSLLDKLPLFKPEPPDESRARVAADDNPLRFAWREGRAAWKIGRPPSANPYSRRTAYHFAWWRGWIEEFERAELDAVFPHFSTISPTGYSSADIGLDRRARPKDHLTRFSVVSSFGNARLRRARFVPSWAVL